MSSRSAPRRSYFDHAASTPVAPQVLRAMQPYFSEKFGNPGSLHSFGQEALAVVDKSREAVAAAIGARFRDIVFTGSATEANNLALKGAVRAFRAARGPSSGAPVRIIVSAIEHESILETAAELEKENCEVVRLPVDRQGAVKLSALAASLNENAAIVSVMYANNETGAVQPIAKIAGIIRDFRKSAPARGPYPLFHTDAAQALQFLDCNVERLGVDLMTLSGHKIYGPKGIGALYVRTPSAKLNLKPYTLAPLLAGGGQEFGLRSGTENTAFIAAFAAAMLYIEEDKDKHARRIAGLKEAFLRGVKKTYPRALLNGPKGGLPHIANVWFPGYEAQDVLIRLDLAGIAVSAGSACAARSSKPSHVLEAMDLGGPRSRESIRFSFGRPTTGAEVKKLIKILAGLRSS